MAWEVVITDSAAADLEAFDDPQATLADVFDWVRLGPPCDNPRRVGPAVLYQHVLAGGVRLDYFVGTAPRAYVAIVRIRRL